MALTRITTGSISANSISAEKMQNAAIQARHFQVGTITVDLLDANANVTAVETRINANLDIVQDNVSSINDSVNIVQSNLVLAEANVVQVQQNLTSNINLVQANVVLAEANVVQVQQNVTANLTDFASFANTNFDTKANVSSTYIQLNSNLNAISTNVAAVISNATAFASYANTNLDTKANVSATYFLALANDYATYTLLNANVNDVQDNVTSVHSGSQEFTSSKVFQQNVTIQGNLIVVGSQVDLGVGTATIDDNFIVVSANLTETPSTDSGIIINRGPEGNTFIGDHIEQDGIVFVLSQSPHDNTTIAIQEYLDVHANAFHAASEMNFSRAHVAARADESTGLIFDTTNNHVKFIISGTEVGNTTSTGARFDAVFSDGVELRANDYATYTLLNANLDVIQDNVATNATDITNLETRRNDNTIQILANVDLTNDNAAAILANLDAYASYGNTNFDTKANVSATYIQLNANIDIVTDNLVTAQTVAHANDFITYTRLNANVNAVQSNLSTAHTSLSANINTVQTNVDAITGGGTFLAPFTNVNTATGTSNVFFVGRNIAAEANVTLVFLDGVSQPNTEYVVNASNDTVQFTDATIPSGAIVQIYSMT